MAQIITSGTPFGTGALGDGTGTTKVSWIIGGAGDVPNTAPDSGYADLELRCIGAATFNVPSGLTVTLEKTFHNPRDPNAVWYTVMAGLTNQEYPYTGPIVSGIRFTRTAGTGVIRGTISERTGGGGSAASPSSVQGPAASGAAASGNPVLVAGQYNSTPPTFTNGNATTLQTDVNGYLKVREQYQDGYSDNTNNVAAVLERPLAGVSTYSPSIFTNFGANTTLNVKAAAANVFSIYCQNTNAAIRYIQLHNTATIPAGGAVPLVSFMIPANGVVFVDHTMLPQGGVYLSTGAAFAYSTTNATYTAATAGEQSTMITFK